jgi:hypothetical protein
MRRITRPSLRPPQDGSARRSPRDGARRVTRARPRPRAHHRRGWVSSAPATSGSSPELTGGPSGELRVGATSMMNSISSAPRRPLDWSCCRPHLLHLRVCAATRRTPPAAPAPARHVQPCCWPSNLVGASSGPSLSLGCGCGAVTVPDLHIESPSASRPHPGAGAGRDGDRTLGNAPAAVEDTRRPGSETRRMRPPLRRRGSAGGG